MFERSDWPAGPWDNEPDHDVWREAQTNLLCAIVRHENFGSLCGYVRIPKVCPLHGSARDVVAALVSAHGGVTFAGDASGDALPRGWWVGFDTAHGFDVQPGMLAMRRELDLPVPEGMRDRYRDWAYVRAEVEALAQQLVALPKDAL